MKYLNIYILVLVMSLFAFSCTESFECDNYEVLEGSVSLNGEKMYPVTGTLLTNVAVLGLRSVGWIVRAVEDDCELNNMLIINIGINEDDPITGTYDFAMGDVGGQISYDLEVDGTGGTVLSFSSGTVEVTEGSNGVFDLDVDAETTDGEAITMSVSYKFE